VKNFKSLKNILLYLPIPKNLSLNWNWGRLLGLFLVIQIIRGFFIVIKLRFNSSLRFEIVINIVQDSSYGWLFRLMHARGASWYFLIIYLHIARGLYYKSYKLKAVWVVGVIIYIIRMAVAFIGYVLPWGQISFWAATVITNLLRIIPYVGLDVVEWVWGGYGVGNPTLTRFFALHYLLPFVIVILVLVHLIFLHNYTSSNPSGIDREIKLSFHYSFIVKDFLVFATVIYVFIIFTLMYGYNFIDPENFIEANSLVTPKHIQPEWYFLFAYAILRRIPNKRLGVVFLLARICILFILLLKSNKKTKYSLLYKINFWLLSIIWILLTYLGRCAAQPPFILISQVCRVLYFLVFFVILLL